MQRRGGWLCSAAKQKIRLPSNPLKAVDYDAIALTSCYAVAEGLATSSGIDEGKCSDAGTRTP